MGALLSALFQSKQGLSCEFLSFCQGEWASDSKAQEELR